MKILLAILCMCASSMMAADLDDLLDQLYSPLAHERGSALQELVDTKDEELKVKLQHRWEHEPGFCYRQLLLEVVTARQDTALVQNASEWLSNTNFRPYATEYFRSLSNEQLEAFNSHIWYPDVMKHRYRYELTRRVVEAENVGRRPHVKDLALTPYAAEAAIELLTQYITEGIEDSAYAMSYKKASSFINVSEVIKCYFEDIENPERVMRKMWIAGLLITSAVYTVGYSKDTSKAQSLIDLHTKYNAHIIQPQARITARDDIVTESLIIALHRLGKPQYLENAIREELDMAKAIRELSVTWPSLPVYMTQEYTAACTLMHVEMYSRAVTIFESLYKEAASIKGMNIYAVSAINKFVISVKYNLARCKSAQFQTLDALDHLKDIVQKGFCDWRWILWDEEFKPLLETEEFSTWFEDNGPPSLVDQYLESRDGTQ